MKIEIFPTEKPEQLAENLEKRVEKVEIEGGTLEVEADRTEFLEIVPGVEKFKAEGEVHESIGGSPVDEQVYARIESKEDAVKCLLATIEGFNVVVLETEREWDLRKLKDFNPDIKQLKTEEPVEELDIEYALFNSDNLEKINVEMPGDEEVLKIYREMLT